MRYYHSTPSENRDSILRQGLLASKSYAAATGGFGALYFSSKPSIQCGMDCWAVDLNGLETEEDFCDSLPADEQWVVVYASDIEPTRMSLV